MPRFTDQLGRTIDLPQVPKRIISLVPSQTELLFDLGLNEEVVGITKFCIHPDWAFRSKARVGGTKNVHFDRVRALQPDLIIANKEENVQAQVEELSAAYPVWVSDINTLEDALSMIRLLGEVTGKGDQAKAIAHTIEAGFTALKPASFPLPTAYLIWKDPYMSIGRDTFIHDLMGRAGFGNLFADRERYPEVSVHELHERGCRLLLLSSEPYPFAEKHIRELQEQLPDTTIRLVDGEMFSWYGSRLQYSPAYFARLIDALPPFS